MVYKNRKKNYPFYETVHMSDVRAMVEQVADRYPDRYSFSYKKHPSDKEITHDTYAQSRDYVRALGTEFISIGMRDHKVALIGESSVEWFYSYFALMSIGAVNVPLDKELPVGDMASIMNTAGCDFVIYSAMVEKKVEELRSLVPTLKTFIGWGEGLAPDVLVLDTLRENGKQKLLAGDRSYFDYKIDPDKLASIVFTSGTTGKGKGVMLSTKNICSDMEQGIYNFLVTPKTMMTLPPHHTFGSTVNIIGHFCQGVEIYISSGLRYIMQELKEFRPHHLILVPLFVETFYKRIMATAEKNGQLPKLKKAIRLSNALRKVGIDLRRTLFKSVLDNFGGELHMIICGGAALNQDIIDFFESIGIVILNGYGITECAPLISCNRNEYRKTGSVGLPIVGGKVKIDNPNADGEGEICYTGPNVMLGYYENEEATKAAIDGEGYFHTGDLGRVELIDGDQWIYITGRLKNLIILSNGKNVYPEELETDIQGIYGVNEVVVYAGESKNEKLDVIVAEIYPDPELLKMHDITDPQKYFEEEIRKVNKRNAPYKAIGLVKIRSEEFPKNTSKKITRFKIDKTID